MDETIQLIGNYLATFGVQLLIGLLILLVGRWLACKTVDLLEKAMKRAKVDATLTAFALRLCYVALMIFVGLAALGQLGIETTSFIAVLGAAGLAVGLALQGSLSNFASGVMIIAFRPFSVGDAVQAGGEKGKIKAVQIFNTHMTLPDNTHVIIPNTKILSGSITNYSKNPTRRVDMVIGVSYSDDLKKTRKVLTEVVTSHSKVLSDPAPQIEVAELADSSVNFIVRPWVNTPDYWGVKFDLTEQIKLALDENGISIPFPQQDLHVISMPGDS